MSKKKYDTWHSSGVERRDFRSSRDEPEVPAHRKASVGGKCKKNKGGPHEPGDVVHLSWFDVQVCKRCNKHLKYFWRTRWGSFIVE